MSLVNAARIRAFARAQGLLAKTDGTDGIRPQTAFPSIIPEARVVAVCGRPVGPPADHPTARPRSADELFGELSNGRSIRLIILPRCR